MASEPFFGAFLPFQVAQHWTEKCTTTEWKKVCSSNKCNFSQMK